MYSIFSLMIYWRERNKISIFPIILSKNFKGHAILNIFLFLELQIQILLYFAEKNLFGHIFKTKNKV